MENILLLGIISVIIAVGYLIIKLNSQKTNGDSLSLLQNQITSIQTTVTQQLESNNTSISQKINDTQTQQQEFIRTVNNLFSEEVKKVIAAVTNQNNTLDSRLNATNQTLNDLKLSQGKIEKAGEDVKSLAQNYLKLEELLKAPKLRGGLGESMLEEMLRQYLPHNVFDTQFIFKNGTKVDAIIKLSHGKLPIDAKFPKENFQKYYSAQEDVTRNQFYKLFVSDVKKHINDISDKYILPTEGTLDFAFMYIPAENIYYETIIKSDNNIDESISEYARKRRIIPVSPNSFWAHLQIIAMGFKGMEVESNAKLILQTLSQMRGDLERFIEDYNVIGRHLQNAKNKYDEAAREIDKFKSTLDKPIQPPLVTE